MWKLCKYLSRGVTRCNNLPLCGASALPEDDLRSLQHKASNAKFCSEIKTVSSKYTGQSDQQHQQSHSDRQGSTTNFKWVPPQDFSMFIEICGLSSAVAFGLHCSHAYRQKENPAKDSGSQSSIWLRTLASVALAQPGLPSARFNINAVDNHHYSSDATRAQYSSSTQPGCKWVDSTQSAVQEVSLADEVSETMTSLMKNLEDGQKLVADWQNSIGAQLMSSAQKEEISCYDTTVPSESGFALSEQKLAYMKEAFMCFQESRKLGNTKASFNLGICYEQGLGTKVDLTKAIECYEEAARDGHSNAQYNLGLLKKKSKDPSTSALTSIRQATKNGLKETWSTLVLLVQAAGSAENAKVNFKSDCSSMTGSTGSLSEDQTDEDKLFSVLGFRKIQSEPHNLSSCLGEPVHELREGLFSNIGTKNYPPRFCLGDANELVT